MASIAHGVTSGGILAAFALLLGASNLHIGILWAIPFIMQPVQLLAVILVERGRVRKPIAVAGYFVAYAAWIPALLTPLYIDIPHAGAVVLLLLFVAVRGAANAFVNASWTGWLRDMAPTGAIGSFFAARMRIATICVAFSAMSSALFIDWWAGFTTESEAVYGYMIAMLLGVVLFGFGAVGFVMRIPEPRMIAADDKPESIVRMLREPFLDRKFVALLRYLFVSNFVIYLALPFFSVYMLTRLELPLSLVVALGVTSQMSNILFIRVWGRFVDDFGSKAILSLASSLYFLVILGWIFTTLPDRHSLTIPLLALLHVLVGIAAAGYNISTATIRMKMSPALRSTSYLTASSLAGNLGAGISPLIGGAFVDFFSKRSLSISVEWIDPLRVVEFPAVFLSGYDFLFAIAFIFGAASLLLIARVSEEGETDSEAVMNELMAQTRENLRVLNSVPGFGSVLSLPIAPHRYLRGMPGLDVAFGVTVYQLSSSIKSAVTGIERGEAGISQFQRQVRSVVGKAAERTAGLSEEGLKRVSAVSQTVMRATVENGRASSRLVSAAAKGTVSAMAASTMKPQQVISALMRGFMRGAIEAGVDISSVVKPAMGVIRDAAPELGLTEEEALRHAVEAIMEEAEDTTETKQDQIRRFLLDEILSKDQRPR